jgi:hypothetical protein
MSTSLSASSPSGSSSAVLFFYLLHAIQQTMFNPQVIHKPLRNPTNIIRDIVKERLIARQHQLFKLRQVPTLHPRKHLEDINQSKTGDILIAIRKR